MCLSIVICNPKGLIEEGTLSSNFEYAITHNSGGHRCGYIKMLPGHPWHGVEHDEIEHSVMVHGGLTFSESDVPCDKAGADNGWWLGFDCAHGGDAFDWDLASKEHRQISKLAILAGYTNYNKGIVRTTEYVRDQLEYLGLQAAAAVYFQEKPDNLELTPCLT